MAYSEEFISNALALLQANGGNVARTAEAMGVDRKSLRNWRDNPPVGNSALDEAGKILPEKKRNLADALEKIVWMAVDLLPGKLPEANVRELVGTIGQGTEKMRLLRGESTERTEEVTVRRVNAVPREYADRHHMDRNGHDK